MPKCPFHDPCWPHLLVGVLVIALGCRAPTARSDWTFDEIESLVVGCTADQVLHLLGEPDSRRRALDGAERWIWWHYTRLDGNDQPPERRGQVVHLEILMTGPALVSPRRSASADWQVDRELGVTYRLPDSNRGRP